MRADELDPKPAEPAHATAGRESARSVGEVREGAAIKRPGAGLALLALLLAALALLAAAWMWWQAGAVRKQQAMQLQTQEQQYQVGLQRLEQALASAQDSASRQAGSQSAAQVGDFQRRLQILEATQSANDDFRSETMTWTRSAQAALEDTQARLNALDERLRNLAARSAQSDSELELEEIDYLLRMAQERLQLFGDTRNADRALQLADHQFVAFDNPMFIALRREIAAARQALAATDVPDIVTLAAELDKVQDSLAALPFKISEYETAARSQSNDTDISWWQRLKNSLSGLITVRRVADDELGLPALADQQALRQRAWVQIEQARLAALNREQEIYQDALLQAEATLTHWFAADHSEVRLALSGLKALQQRNVNPPMPDISGPWNTLRSIRGAGLSPTLAPPPAPTSAPASVPAQAPTPAPSEAITPEITNPVRWEGETNADTADEPPEEAALEEFDEPDLDTSERPGEENGNGVSLDTPAANASGDSDP